MRSMLRYNEDYYGGALIMLVGLLAIYGGTRYEIGTLMHMGPGYFPTSIGIVLTAIGIAIAVSARPTAPEAKKGGLPLDVPGALCILGGLAAFMVLGEYGGLVPATFAVVFISALGDRQNTIWTASLLAIAMVAIAVVLFWWALQIQISPFQWGI